MQKAKLDFKDYCKDGNFFEKIIETFYRLAVKPGDVVIDCGAHLGMHTGPLSEVVGETGLVHAIEALPYLAEKLSDAKAGNVVVHATAISDFTGETTFHHATNVPGLSGIKKRIYYRDVQLDLITVPVTTLDLLVPQANPTFIKLDLEGGEFAALQGARHILGRAKPMLIFEHGGETTAECNGYKLMEFHDYLKSFGYNIFNIFGQNREGIHFGQDIPWYFVACAQQAHLEIIENSHIALAAATAAYIENSGQRFVIKV